APNQPKDLYPYLLEPVLRTYHHFGIPASLKSFNDIQVSNKKIGGTGAGTINNATVLVGSFLYDFDYQLMSQCANTPSENFRACLEGILENNITTIKAQIAKTPTINELTDVFLENIKESLGFEIEQVSLSTKENEAISNAEIELTDDEWLNIEGKKLVLNGLKISAGVYLLEKSLPFFNSFLTIRIQYEKKSIHTIWLESNDLKIQASLIIVATEINKLKPTVDYGVIRALTLEITSKLSTLNDHDAIRLAREIYEIANFTEY
ncbi:MAG: hypothetical protein OEM38_09995, partial [Gammaproteobacteria bacterium]|nr:hypothetical protein [Gammaproteobacteria bacterium]